MLFTILGHANPNSTDRDKYIEPHLENLRKLDRAGKILVSGPFTDGSGGMVLADFDSAAEATVFANNDPFVTGGVWSRVEVKPFRKAFPENR